MRGRAGGVRTLALCALAGAIAIGAQPAHASTGELTFADCKTSNTDVFCTALNGSTPGGAATALDSLYGVGVSPDGGDVYTVSGITGDAVSQFRRDPANGALSFAACITSNSLVNECDKLAGSASNGLDTPLYGLRAVALSPDGESLYTGAEFGDSVATFTRDPDTGTLTYAGCISSDSDVAGCAHIAGAAAGGADTGLDGLRSLAVSPDGESVYAAAEGGDALATFSRSPNTGSLAYEGCITSNSNVAGCTQIPGSTAGANNTGLASLYSVAVSPGGDSVYAASYNGHAIARFDRATSGVLTYRDCLSSSTGVAGCTALPGATANGDDTNLGNAISVTVSADGNSVYAAGEYAASLTHFTRDPGTGELSQHECFTTNSNATSCTQLPGAVPGAGDTILEYLEAVVASGDGNNVYVASYSGTVDRFARDPASGNLTYSDCLTASTDIAGCAPIPGVTAPNAVGTAFWSLSSLALSPDGLNLYGGAEAGDALSRMQRELPPPAVVPPSNEFSFGKVKRNKRKGTAKLPVELPGPGQLQLAGKGLKRAERQATAAGEVRLPVKAKGKKARKLRKRGKVKVTAKVTFTPTGGTPNTKTKKLKLIRRR